MKTIYKYLALLGIVLLLFTSCEKELKVDLPSSEKPVLNIYGFMYAGEPTYLYISKTIPITGNLKTQNFMLDRATVRYYINDALVEEKTVQRKGNEGELEDVDKHKLTIGWGLLSDKHLYYKSRVKPKSGERVRIEVSAEGLEQVVIDAVMPTTPKVSEVVVETVSGSNGVLFGVDAFESYLLTTLKNFSGNFGVDWETAEKPSLSDYVWPDRYQRVSFKLSNASQEELYSVGVPKDFRMPISDLYTFPTSWEGYLDYELVCSLYRLEQVVHIEVSPLFFKKARGIAKQKRNPREKSAQFFLPYFSTATQESGVVEVQLLLPMFKKNPHFAQVLDPERRLAIYALSPEYAYFAESGYGKILHTQDEEGEFLSDVEFEGPLAEYQIERSNVKNGMGAVYIATPFYIPLN